MNECSPTIHGSLDEFNQVFVITIGESVHTLNRERAEALFALLDFMLDPPKAFAGPAYPPKKRRTK